LADFDVRSTIGPDLPLFGNLGIAQVENLIEKHAIGLIGTLVERLQLDGIIIHVNPLQEALQQEGDKLLRKPIDVISELLSLIDIPVIVKEVGQGMGPRSLRALFQLPLAAIDFGASGGTNFALLEILRRSSNADALKPLTSIGHTAENMVDMVNEIIADLGDRLLCQEVIISGGVNDFLDGYFLTTKLNLNSIYGQASAFLRHAMGDYQELHDYMTNQATGLALAQAYLRVK